MPLATRDPASGGVVTPGKAIDTCVRQTTAGLTWKRREDISAERWVGTDDGVGWAGAARIAALRVATWALHREGPWFSADGWAAVGPGVGEFEGASHLE
jgi:hypothetical protein